MVAVDGRMMLFELVMGQAVEAGVRPHRVAAFPPRFKQLRITKAEVEFAQTLRAKIERLCDLA